MTGILILCAGIAALATLVVLGGNRKPTPPSPPSPGPTSPDLAIAIMAEIERRRRERDAAELRARLEAILSAECPPPASAPGPKA